MGDIYPKVRVGVVQAAPVYLDREASAEKAIAFIAEAGQKGVELLAFPEGFIPTHPEWYRFQPSGIKRSRDLAVELFKNSVEIPGPTTEALCTAAAKARVNVVIGVCEKRPKTTGTMFNTQIFIARNGRILGKHQKIMPTTMERLVHTGGSGDGLRVYETDIGRVSGLLCGENSNPLAIFTLLAQSTQIHVASWPNHFTPISPRMSEAATLAGRSLAYKAKCFVLNACGTISDKMRELSPYVDEDRAFLADPQNGGGSTIIGPSSAILAGPMNGAQEGILVAEIDLEECIKGKLSHDFSGHYNRQDIFTLKVNTSMVEIFQWVGTTELLHPSPGEKRELMRDEPFTGKIPGSLDAIDP